MNNFKTPEWTNQMLLGNTVANALQTICAKMVGLHSKPNSTSTEEINAEGEVRVQMCVTIFNGIIEQGELKTLAFLEAYKEVNSLEDLTQEEISNTLIVA